MSGDSGLEDRVRRAAASPIEPITPSAIRARARVHRRRRTTVASITVAIALVAAVFAGDLWLRDPTPILVDPATSEITGTVVAAPRLLENTEDQSAVVVVAPDADSPSLAEHAEVGLVFGTNAILCGDQPQAAGNLELGVAVRAVSTGRLDQSVDPPRVPVAGLHLIDCQGVGPVTPTTDGPPVVSFQVLQEPSRSRIQVPEHQLELIRSQQPNLDPQTVRFATTQAGASYFVAGTPTGPMCLIQWSQAHACVDHPGAAAAEHGVVMVLGTFDREGISQIAVLVPDPYLAVETAESTVDVVGNVAVLNVDPPLPDPMLATLIGPHTARHVTLPEP